MQRSLHHIREEPWMLSLRTFRLPECARQCSVSLELLSDTSAKGYQAEKSRHFRQISSPQVCHSLIRCT